MYLPKKQARKLKLTRMLDKSRSLQLPTLYRHTPLTIPAFDSIKIDSIISSPKEELASATKQSAVEVNVFSKACFNCDTNSCRVNLIYSSFSLSSGLRTM